MKAVIDLCSPDYNFDERWWTGPIDKIERRLSQVTDDTQELAVIVTTGAFCPIHKGHVQMLETAKLELESRGIAVLGGYICPDHDRYVSSKIRSGTLSAAQRLELCELAVEKSDWLMVDRWAAIYASSSVGFTTIVDHIDKMVNHHIQTTRPIRTVYAFGGDNAMFAFSFAARWSCVCVLRPGSKDRFEDMLNYGSIRKNPRIVFSNDTTAPLDSTSIRNGDLSGLLPEVKYRYLAMQMEKARFPIKIDSGSRPHTNVLYLRNEGPWAVQNFLNKSDRSPEQLLDAYQTFFQGLLRVFDRVFRFSEGNAISPHKTVPVQLQDQERAFQDLFIAHERIIDLDSCLPGTQDLHLAQTYKPLVKTPSNLTFAPSITSLGTGTDLAKTGIYVLLARHLPLESETARLVSERLPKDCMVERYLSLTNLVSQPGTDNKENADVRIQGTIDARDFLVGSHDGGVLLQLGEAQLVRAPSVLPYVRPLHHARIDATAEMAFSKAVWELNRDFFQAIGGHLQVQDVASVSQKLWKFQGFPANMPMTELCDWHIAGFEDMVFQKF